ncbi:MAG: transcription elongation factor GreA [Acidothermus sp.]|nr:transcription elongation factor GreA [Acidothermus sp.]MCL6537894.1 transcription elongation factor GreA [Acidothermus sp.]
MVAEPTTTWLTQEAYDRLTAEYNELIGPVRAEIAKKIEAARAEGDLRENGGYHAAKEEQGKIEARIRQLRQILENAKVGEPPADDGVVEPGMVVTVRYEDGEELAFLLGSREETAAKIDVYSPNSPLGTALLGKKVGDTVSYSLPTGASMRVTVVDAKPFTG